MATWPGCGVAAGAQGWREDVRRLARGCLDSAGIESFLTDANVARLESPVTRGMRLQVNADDAEAALALLTESTASNSDF